MANSRQQWSVVERTMHKWATVAGGEQECTEIKGEWVAMEALRSALDMTSQQWSMVRSNGQ